jgi:hypothetical protein
MEHAGAEFFGRSVFLALEQSGFGLMIRDAVLVYPIANVLHVLAVLVFFASVFLMDARVLGLWGGEPVEVVLARWRRLAITAFIVIVGSGIVLLTPEATAMVRNPSFLLKFALIAIALVNVLVMSAALRRHDPMLGDAPALARASAVASIILWLGVAAAGRYIAYI